MKNQNKSSKKRCADEPNINTSIKTLSRKTSRSKSRRQVLYDRRRKKYRLIIKRGAPSDYVFYSVLNTAAAMDLDVAASMITRSILTLYDDLKGDMAKSPYVDMWQKTGERIIVLQGYNHRHLKYLNGEAKYVALGKHAIYHQLCRIMLVLSVFGRKEEIEDVFYGLPYLR